MASILFVQPSFQPPGGGQGVAACMIEALQWEHSVTLLSILPVKLDAINRHFGTALAPQRLQFRRGAVAAARWLERAPLPLSQLRNTLLMRAACRMAGHYDLTIGCHNEAWYGRPGIQYVHYPWAFTPRPANERRWYHGGDRGVRLYHTLCARASGFTWDQMHRNLTLVNSAWTGALYQSRHGGSFRVLHPPVIGLPVPTPWEQREHGFICVGRFSPEKELDKVMRIVAAVRGRGHPVTLTLAGTRDNPGYADRIAAEVHAHGDWVRLVWEPDRSTLLELIGRHRFGIHGMCREHFGMAVAEMVASGCVPFVPDDGGQVEIVDHGRPLTYRSEADAVQSICAVLENPDILARLRNHLDARRGQFTAAGFQKRFRTIVTETLGQALTGNDQPDSTGGEASEPTSRRNAG